MNIVDRFMKETKMLDIHGGKTGVRDIFQYLSDPNTVNKMIVASDMGFPAIAAIVQDLENTFTATSTFPVTTVGSNKNAVARQNVGRMIKFIMRLYGYLPVAGRLSERAKIPNAVGAKFFATGAVYQKLCKEELVLVVTQKDATP